jgi:acyl-coenzyme A thioesterase PaaI-like protein
MTERSTGAAAGPGALFERDRFARHGEVLVPTTLTRGPWDHGFLHGGAVCGAVGWALERARPDDDLMLARMTVEIRSMVPLGPLRTEAAVSKPGRRTRVIDATLHHEGRLVARATSQWVLHRGAEAPGAAIDWRPVASRPPTPADPGATDQLDYPRPGFNCDAVELRPIRSTTEDPGPGLIWARLRHPVVAGEATSNLLAVLTLSDLGVAVGWEPAPSGAGFINADVTVQLHRYPVTEWVLMASRVHASALGVGFCETVLSDDAGLFGRVLQTLVETPEDWSTPGLTPS